MKNFKIKGLHAFVEDIYTCYMSFYENEPVEKGK